MHIALDRDIRRTFERVVRDARMVAEKGALNALGELGVADAKRPAWLSPAQGELRNRLRAHARTLGDRRNPDDTMRMTRLVREIAYAHWHRALFARFLLENGLLVDVEAGNAPVSAADIRAIAEEEKRDVAEVAAEFAQPMLPEIFRNEDPVLALALPPEARQGIAQLVDGLPALTFKADDALGWTYQFWQSDRKKQVNESEVKIGADELPAVTQLFTEDYMVLFLLENTLGAWWVGKKLADNPDLALNAADEDELRRKLSLDGYQWTYLRFVRDEDANKTGAWRPAAGTFPGWPRTTREITMLDPCMGSGHFLLFALDILVALRKAEEGFDEEAAVLAVLSENLHGLEIDPRCTQIAAFALALSAWKRIGRVRPLPTLNLACSGLAIGMGRAEFVRLAERISEVDGFAGGATDMLGRERNPIEEQALARRRGGLERLYDLFVQAPVLGSLIEPRRALGDFGDILSEGFDGLSGVIGRVLDKAGGDPDVREAAVTAQGLSMAAELLGRQFSLVATNVPYLGRGKMDAVMFAYTDQNHPDARADLAACMLERSFTMLKHGGCIACVNIENIISLGSYQSLRRKITNTLNIDFIARLGSGAFSSFSGEVVKVILTSFSKRTDGARDKYFAIDVAGREFDKLKGLSKKFVNVIEQKSIRLAPSLRFVLDNKPFSNNLLEERADAYQGIVTGDQERFTRSVWEVPKIFRTGWEPCRSAVNEGDLFSGCNDIVFWEDGKGRLHEYARETRTKLHDMHESGNLAWGKKGVSVNRVGSLRIGMYLGEKFHNSVAVVIPKNADDFESVWSSCSDDLEGHVRRLNSALGVTNRVLLQVPLLAADNKHPILVPYSNDPTQWLFAGNPRGSLDPNTLDADGIPTRPSMAGHPLQVAVARLLGYRWPRQTGSSFMDCPAITAPDEIDASTRVDADGIVCLPALAGEAGAAERLRGVLQAAWGPEWREGVVRSCLQAEEAKVEDLDAWLADEFFDGHCRLFHQTPFIWHVWDGLRGGFSALVNYHMLCAPDGGGRRLLEKLRDTYLGEWISRQRRLASDGDALAEERLAAAEHLRTELTNIIEGEPPYDIFVRWKPLPQQPIGWEPDIDDGVRLNIRPFITARPRAAKGAKTCILRVRPGIKKYEGADRGGEPYREKADYPWFWAENHDVSTEDFAGGAEFRGRRYNDFHFSRRFKQAAIAAKTAGSEGAE